THAQVVAALAAERIDWLAYTVQYRAKDGSIRAHAGMSKADADKMRTRLLREGVGAVAMARTIACSGWPQLPYDELIKLPELPPTPIEELRKIRDPQMRKDALRARRELDSARATEYAAAEAE
ncbi:MAG: hypothetical protein KGK30_08780, partial [Elusimicrobia bacterium]|nr:hypothetical protein [Elusimicrobiota bacterium]